MQRLHRDMHNRLFAASLFFIFSQKRLQLVPIDHRCIFRGLLCNLKCLLIAGSFVLLCRLIVQSFHLEKNQSTGVRVLLCLRRFLLTFPEKQSCRQTYYYHYYWPVSKVNPTMLSVMSKCIFVILNNSVNKLRRISDKYRDHFLPISCCITK